MPEQIQEFPAKNKQILVTKTYILLLVYTYFQFLKTSFLNDLLLTLLHFMYRADFSPYRAISTVHIQSI